MNALEIKVLEVTPAVVNFNYEEMKQVARNIKAEYEGLIFTEEIVKEGKKTVAELKNIQKSINDFKIKTKKELTESVTMFETNCKEIISEFDEPITFISTQLDEFETERIRIKTLVINQLIADFYAAQNVEPKFQTVEFRKEWLNITKKEKEIAQDISHDVTECLSKQEQYYLNVELIKTVAESINAKYQLGVAIQPETFIPMLDFKDYASIKLQMEQSAERQQAQEQAYKAKVEQEAQTKAFVQVEKVMEEATKFIPVEAAAEEPIKTINISLQGTQSQFDAFKEYLKASGMKYKML
jgi:hypothetical protein